ncbi:rhamnogalacturonan acetylesterase [Streptomyces sp. NPDC005907]|uniref:rhamnogalacturonan acetylesterase n=1 Tax=Streptomyces sp. NPDC005907 TaxID=3154571 RepID=UPI003403C389
MRTTLNRDERGVRRGAAVLLILAALAGTGAVRAEAATRALPAGCSGAAPIRCHYAVPPGEYDVTVSIGGAASAGRTEMWVEARRLMLPATSTAAGAGASYSFTVDVRQPEGQPTGQGGNGNPGLDLRFAGAAPQVSAVSVSPAPRPLVAYLAGDSTVCDQPAAPYTGWGQMITTAVRPGAAIANYGDSGESSGSYLSNSALFPALLAKVRTNDPVFIQLGHNDKQTSASAYRNNLTTMITRVRAKGGIPVLVTPPVRRLFDGNRLTATALHVNGVGVNLPAEMRSVGAAQGVPLIDLTARSKTLIESLGPSASAQLFLRSSVDGVTDNTHFSQYGATRIGDLLLQSIREQNLPLATYLR